MHSLLDSRSKPSAMLLGIDRPDRPSWSRNPQSFRLRANLYNSALIRAARRQTSRSSNFIPPPQLVPRTSNLGPRTCRQTRYRPWVAPKGLDFIDVWCRGEDSNLHGLPHLDLNQARLPIPPPRLPGSGFREKNGFRFPVSGFRVPGSGVREKRTVSGFGFRGALRLHQWGIRMIGGYFDLPVGDFCGLDCFVWIWTRVIGPGYFARSSSAVRSSMPSSIAWAARMRSNGSRW
jgi:hypothetical protein